MKTNPNDLAYQVLTKREYFAAMAMQGLLVNFQKHEMFGNATDSPLIADVAVEQADALIKALNEPTP